jgi:serine/threonine-protein kinase
MEPATGSQTPAAPNQNAAGADAAPDLTGQSLGDFRILRHLGEGGMGQVYLAEQKSLGRKVALKVLRADLAANKTALARFDAEAKAVAQATHANIVQVYAVGESDGLHFMALEYVEGRNLRQYLEKKGPPELMLAITIMRQVAAALQRAGELGIIHRDIKPENILLTRKGEVKVADFGLSRIYGDDRQPLNLTQSGVTMGTPLYMSPEQVEGKPVDPRTDIYSFGVTCYHLLAGNPPFRGTAPFEVAVQHVQNEPEPLASIRPDLPPELCQLVHRMLAKKPEDRIQTGREIVRELIRLRDNLVGSGNSGLTYLVQTGPMAAEPEFDSVLTQSLPVPTAPRHGWRWLALAGVVLAFAVGLGYGWWQVHDQSAAQQQVPPTAKSPQAAGDPFKGLPDVAVKANGRPSKEEVELLKKIEVAADGRAVLKAKVDLGVYYLKERHLNDAEQLFKGLEGQNVKAKTTTLAQAVGHAGRAVVLAFHDESKESNKLFGRALNAKPVDLPKGKGVQPVWHYYPGLSELVARALDQNFANDPAGFPAELKPHRLPPEPKR